jgi:hypothetical protein
MKLPKSRFLRWSIVIAASGAVSTLAFVGIRVHTAEYRNEVAEVTKVFQHAIQNLKDLEKTSRITGDTGVGYELTKAEFGSSNWNGKMGGIVGALCRPANKIYHWPKLTRTEISDARYYIDCQIKENARRKFPNQAGASKQWVPLIFTPGILTGLFLASFLLPRKIRSF